MRAISTLVSFISLAVTAGCCVPMARADGLSSSPLEGFERLDDVTIPIRTISGSCPNSVTFWRDRFDFEHGAYTGVMLNVATIGQGETEFIDNQERSVTFKTPLKPQFYSCTGTLSSGPHPPVEHRHLYHLWFEQGHVFFRLDLGPKPADATQLSSISHQEIIGQYPYAQWLAPH
ncbi:MAG: hypothetical protein AAFY17_16490 [Cyanobacteria bacterium J06642_11]